MFLIRLIWITTNGNASHPDLITSDNRWTSRYHDEKIANLQHSYIMYNLLNHQCRPSVSSQYKRMLSMFYSFKWQPVVHLHLFFSIELQHIIQKWFSVDYCWVQLHTVHQWLATTNMQIWIYSNTLFKTAEFHVHNFHLKVHALCLRHVWNFPEYTNTYKYTSTAMHFTFNPRRYTPRMYLNRAPIFYVKTQVLSIRFLY